MFQHDNVTPEHFALTMWTHYQEALNSNNFKDETHLEYIKSQEEYYRQKYLNATQHNDDVLLNAGFSASGKVFISVSLN